MSSSTHVVPARFRFGRDPDAHLTQPAIARADELMLRRWYRLHDRGRPLARAELELLVEDMSAHPDLWRHLLHHSPAERHHVRMLADANVEIRLICWCPTHETGFHDHGGSRGAVAVLQGMLSETLPNVGGEHPRALYATGDRFSFGAAHIHEVQHAAGDPAASLHAYSPPLGGTLTPRPCDRGEELC